MRQTIVDTSFGEVMVKETEGKRYLDCYIGDNFDDYLFTIEGRICDGDLTKKIESMYG